jgi:tRNA dimethylallyltransferase
MPQKKPRKSPTKPNVVVIVGPTGSGKTALAVKLVRRFGGVVLSADSRQLYRHMDIGTAKPTTAEQRAAKHYFIDVIDPNQTYSAGRFQREAYKLVHALHTAHPDEPIFIVGGTYLYVDAVLKGWDFAKTQRNSGLRKKLSALSLKQLQQKLRELDPGTALKIDMQNPRRLIRALEVVMQTGGSFYAERAAHAPDWNTLWIGLRVPQAKLDRSNARRIDRMFRQGWTREVTRLAKKYPITAPGFYAHGYREALAFIRGEHTLQETKAQIAINTRHHTKRQMAWFKKNPDIHWQSPTNVKRAAQLLSRHLQNTHDR